MDGTSCRWLNRVCLRLGHASLHAQGPVTPSVEAQRGRFVVGARSPLRRQGAGVRCRPESSSRSAVSSGRCSELSQSTKVPERRSRESLFWLCEQLKFRFKYDKFNLENHCVSHLKRIEHRSFLP